MLQKSNGIVTVNLSSLKENLVTLGAFLEENTQIMAVIKANAYGHGAVKVAETLSPLVEAFAVNDILEGIELRENGIKKPILIFGVPEASFAQQYKEYNLTATISSEAHFNLLPGGISYHLNFDTGMGRLGFQPGNAEKVARLVDEHKDLACTGIYSHFATADKPNSAQVDQQYERFMEILPHFPANIKTHICNTGGAAFYKSKQFDMVRLGIGLYGYSPGAIKIEGLKPILKWSSKLVQIKKVGANKTVSYGANWKTPSEGFIGVIPVGYSDGLRRNLTGKLSVRIGTREYEVAGTIAMNFCMVYLGEDYYEPGTVVELIYPGNDAENWAANSGTISYEILTGIHERIPRKYRY